MASLFLQRYLRLCEEADLPPAQDVLQHAQQGDGAKATTRSLLLGESTLSTRYCQLLCRALQRDTHFTELVLRDTLLDGESPTALARKQVRAKLQDEVAGLSSAPTALSYCCSTLGSQTKPLSPLRT